MRELEYKSRYEPLYEAELGELVSELKYIPFKGNQVGDTQPGWLHLSHSMMNIEGGLGGWIYAKATPALIEIINRRSIYGCKMETAARDHNLELIRRNDGSVRFFYGFQQILGSYCLTDLDPEKTMALLLRAKEEGHVPVDLP